MQSKTAISAATARRPSVRRPSKAATRAGPGLDWVVDPATAATPPARTWAQWWQQLRTRRASNAQAQQVALLTGSEPLPKERALLLKTVTRVVQTVLGFGLKSAYLASVIVAIHVLRLTARSMAVTAPLQLALTVSGVVYVNSPAGQQDEANADASKKTRAAKKALVASLCTFAVSRFAAAQTPLQLYMLGDALLSKVRDVPGGPVMVLSAIRAMWWAVSVFAFQEVMLQPSATGLSRLVLWFSSLGGAASMMTLQQVRMLGGEAAKVRVWLATQWVAAKGLRARQQAVLRVTERLLGRKVPLEFLQILGQKDLYTLSLSLHPDKIRAHPELQRQLKLSDDVLHDLQIMLSKLLEYSRKLEAARRYLRRGGGQGGSRLE